MRSGPDGFTVTEMLVASAVGMAVMGVVFQMATAAQSTFQVQLETTDMQQRLRVGIESLTRDLSSAGAAPESGSRSTLNHDFAPVMPYRRGARNDDPRAGIFYRPDAISVVMLPSPVVQTTIGPGAIVARGGRMLMPVLAQAQCPPDDALCGFKPDMQVVIFDASGAWGSGSISDVQSGARRLEYDGDLSAPYRAGSRVAQVQMDTYYLKAEPNKNIFELMHYDGAQTDLPVVEHVVKLEFEYFGDPAPPSLLADVPLNDPAPSWTTYGPSPPSLNEPNPNPAWPDGENCVFRVSEGRHIPRLGILAAGIAQVPLTSGVLTDGPWCPDAASPERYDADLLRVQRVRVIIRVQVAAAALRGPAGILFASGGTSRGGDRYVPDREITFDVSPRNLSLGR